MDLLGGMQVCFTGAAQGPNGEPLDRDELEDHARRHGLEPVKSVTKKNCQLLVAADPASLSRKAQSAQKFGIPVAAIANYLAAMNTGTPMRVNRLPVKGVGQVCTECGHSWIAARRKSNPVCDGCRTKARPPAGPNDGRNAANAATRAERLERCRRAVELQNSGGDRTQIAEQLGASEEGVKALLRDGKFYANPETDQERLELAERASAARQSGMNRAAFADEAGLSKGKAEECWKDADVLFGGMETDSATSQESYS
ncbi:MAG: hypothetical protein ACKOI2_03765 [Actinomycetota bacterium]